MIGLPRGVVRSARGTLVNFDAVVSPRVLREREPSPPELPQAPIGLMIPEPTPKKKAATTAAKKKEGPVMDPSPSSAKEEDDTEEDSSS